MEGRILIVDDDSGHLTMLNTVLSSLGHRVERATDGKDFKYHKNHIEQ